MSTLVLFRDSGFLPLSFYHIQGFQSNFVSLFSRYLIPPPKQWPKHCLDLKSFSLIIRWTLQSVFGLLLFPSPVPLFCLRYSLLAFRSSRINQYICGARITRLPTLHCRGRWKATLCRGISNCWPYIQYMKGKTKIRHMKKLKRTMMPLILCNLVSSRPSWTSGVEGQV